MMTLEKRKRNRKKAYLFFIYKKIEDLIYTNVYIYNYITIYVVVLVI